MALQSIYASNRRAPSHILRPSDRSKNNLVATIHRVISPGCNLLLHHNSRNRNDSHQRGEHARWVKRFRNNMPRNCDNWIDGYFVILFADGWALAVLVGARIL